MYPRIPTWHFSLQMHYKEKGFSWDQSRKNVCLVYYLKWSIEVLPLVSEYLLRLCSRAMSVDTELKCEDYFDLETAW